jgi:hypothetical protein
MLELFLKEEALKEHRRPKKPNRLDLAGAEKGYFGHDFLKLTGEIVLLP